MTVAVEDLTKHYGPTLALRRVSLSVRPGEVLGIIGQNGAGKSTLIRLLSGVIRSTSGTIRIDGTPVSFAGPGDAHRAGVQTVHQNIDEGIIPGHTVAENLALDRLDRWVSPRRTRAIARTVAEAADLDADLDLPVESLTASQRQHVVIARALARRPRLLILDEPTAALPADEADDLVTTIRRLAAAGVAVLYVSHRLSEIDSVADRVAVLRDGAVTRTFTAPFDPRALVEAMLGDNLAAAEHASADVGAPVLEAEEVRCFPRASPFSLTVRAGEIVGLTGLIGAGKTELLEQIFGARPAAGPSAPIETLSGGNQQKVLAGRWFSGVPRRLVLLDEPFRGVDVGARADIARRLRSLAAGTGVLLASSDPQEVTLVADRILVLRNGTLAGGLAASEASAEGLADLIAGE